MSESYFDLNIPHKDELSLSGFLETLLQNELEGFFYLHAYRNSSNMVYDYLVRYVNPAALRMLGKKWDRVVGRTIFELFPTFQTHTAFKALQTIFDTAETKSFETYFDTEGFDNWYRFQITRYSESELMVSVRDITFEKKSNLWSRVLTKGSEALLSNRFWRLSIPVILKYIYSASNATRVNFYNIESAPDQSLYRLELMDSWFAGKIRMGEERIREVIEFYPGDPSRNFISDRKIIEYSEDIDSPESQRILKKYNLRRVVFIPVLVNQQLKSLISIENPKGKFLHSREKRILKSLSSNISIAIQRNLDRKKLEESEEYYRHLVSRLDAVVYTAPLGNQYDVTYISPSVYQLLGITHEEYLSDPSIWVKLLHKLDRKRVLDLIEMADRNRKSFEIEYRCYTKEGKLKWIIDTAILVRDELGNESHYLGYMKDITAIKRQESEQMESKKMESIGRFSGGIAHDLNNMIQPAMIYLNLIRDGIENGVDLKSYLPKVDRALLSLQRSRDLISKILNFSRVRPLEQTDTAFWSALVGVVEDMSLNSQIPINLSRHESVDNSINVPLDGASLAQIVQNIIKNSQDAIQGVENPRIEIYASLAEKLLELYIRDNGPGIPPDQLGQIYDPFFTTKKMGEGTGLGLSIVYGILKSVNGKIRAKNLEEESGLEVLIQLPYTSSSKKEFSD